MLIIFYKYLPEYERTLIAEGAQKQICNYKTYMGELMNITRIKTNK
jgi:hypothetical protein